MKNTAIVILAGLLGWMARGIRFDDPPPAPAPVRPVVRQESEPVFVPPPPVVLRVPSRDTTLGSRNLFAYRSREEPRPLPPPEVRPAAVVPLPAEPPTIARPPEPPPFPWRYIGTIGTARNRVAAFKRDAEILTVRAGEPVGEFVLRAIGVESVEVDGPGGVRRIPLQ